MHGRRIALLPARQDQHPTQACDEPGCHGICSVALQHSQGLCISSLLACLGKDGRDPDRSPILSYPGYAGPVTYASFKHVRHVQPWYLNILCASVHRERSRLVSSTRPGRHQRTLKRRKLPMDKCEKRSWTPSSSVLSSYLVAGGYLPLVTCDGNK